MDYETIKINSKRWFNLKPLLNEIFNDIHGLEGLYQISNYGRVKSLKRNIIKKCSTNIYGYYRLILYKNGKRKVYYIHRLVAETYIKNPQKKLTVNHIDGNKDNNRVDNLEWATQHEQMVHAYAKGLRKKPFKELNINYGKYGNKHYRSKIIFQYDLNGKFIKKWSNAYEIKRETGYSQGNINQCCLGNRKRAYKFIWKYKEEKK